LSRKKRTPGKKRKPGQVTKLPIRQAPALTQDRDRKLSEIIKEMAWSILRDPDAIPSLPAAQAVVMLASAAWNTSVGDTVLRDELRQVIEQLNGSGVTPWAELRSDDTDQLVAELVEQKRERYPNDRRRIIAAEMSSEGNVRVHWVDQEKIITPHWGSANSPASTVTTERGRPIADQLVRAMGKHVGGKIIDFKSALVGRAHAEELQKTVTTREELAGFHPAHAVYVHAQNQVSVMSEQLTALKEMTRFAELISKAEDEYLPSGPPMSPLTASFFTCWALFDACLGPAEETIGTTTMAVGAAFGMHEELVRVMGLMQESRMGVYVHEGGEKDAVVLRELVTDKVCRAIVPSGYRGRKGELWYVRVLPPPLSGVTEHVVFTTPYLLLAPGEGEWQAYFRRTLPDAPLQDRIARYEHHMKFGPTRNYWTEFVFEAYVNHRPDVIFLAGLPDVPESRPHSRVNQR
jgi:hypothetical protein